MISTYYCNQPLTYHDTIMRALSVTDHVFLLLESKKQPMNVAGISIFEIPADADEAYIETLITSITKHSTPEFPFNQVLYKGFFWQESSNFDLSQHFFWHELGEKNSFDDFLAYIAEKHSEVLPKDRPLWQCHLVSNIAPEQVGGLARFAIYFKLNHVLADGVGAMRLWQSCLMTTPNEPAIPFWAIKKTKRTQNSKARQKPRLSTIFKDQAKSLVPVCHALKERFASRNLPDFVSSFDAPASVLNQRISHHRHISTHTFNKTRFERIARTLSTPALPITTNDVILATCAGALRQYLHTHSTLPTKPLIGFVPVSLRKDDSVAGNQLSFLLANLGTTLDNAKERLLIIAKSMQDGKNRFAKLNTTEIINYSLAIYGAFGLNLATGLLPKKQAFNLIISNIPADNDRLYFGQARLSAMYPASVLFDGQALNITLANYANRIDMCLIACQDTLSHLDTLPTFLAMALDELEYAVFG